MTVETDGFIKILNNGRITLPSDFRSLWNIRDGDMVSYRLTERGIFLTPLDVVERKLPETLSSEDFKEAYQKIFKKNRRKHAKSTLKNVDWSREQKNQFLVELGVSDEEREEILNELEQEEGGK